MKWLNESDIITFLSKQKHDLRISNNGRWIDQKCTADVITVVTDCIINYIADEKDKKFSSVDIWYDDYSINTVEAVFKKPKPNDKNAIREYDKFFAHPMKMLAYAGILNEKKVGRRNVYTIIDYTLLEYLSIREQNTLVFLNVYIKKVLSDSSIYWIFEEFFKEQTKKAYSDVKKRFADFLICNTPINRILECNRIFAKVINPLAYKQMKKGTYRGYISKDIITYDALMYNRNNFRDIYADKPKGMTRKEYALTKSGEINDSYYNYQLRKAKNFLKAFNDKWRNGNTEHIEDKHIGEETVIHHIFPKAEYIEICHYYENLIALTPTQHTNYAHPSGRTREINEQYQHLLLLSKTDRIRENLTSIEIEHIYEFEKLLTVLSIGFDNDTVHDIADMDFIAIINIINRFYERI